MLKYGILASGGLGAICIEHILKSQKINFIFTNKDSTAIIDLSKRYHIPIFIGNPRKNKASEFINSFDTDVILSINYVFIVEQDIIQHPKKYAINFHGSLLPKYRGRTPHVWAIINNEKQTGITAHFITEGCDEGDIVYQETVIIGEETTGADILKEFNSRYPKILSKVINMIETNKVQPIKQDVIKATYFGRRTPEDGRISWEWQKEQIHNWIRAQAKPYPGAFSFYNNIKVTIHKIAFSDWGFYQDDENGKILEITSEGKLIVKTPNGAIKLLDIDAEGEILFKKHDKLK